MIVRVVALAAVWVLLQGELTVGNVVGGLLVVGVIEVVFPMQRRTTHRVHPIGAAVYAAVLLADLVRSSWAVLATVIRPDADRVHTEVIPVTLTTRSPLVATLVANSITLTPGTMTVDVHPVSDGCLRLDVHVLGRTDHATFVESILALERRVLRAVEPVSNRTVASSADPAGEPRTDEVGS